MCPAPLRDLGADPGPDEIGGQRVPSLRMVTAADSGWRPSLCGGWLGRERFTRAWSLVPRLGVNVVAGRT